MLELLIAKGASVTARADGGTTCLHEAAERSGIAVLNTVMAHNPGMSVDVLADDVRVTNRTTSLLQRKSVA